MTLALHMHRDQGLKCRIYRPIFRRYIGYRELTKRFLIHKVVCWKNREKSEKIADISAKYRNLDDISVEISTRGRHACGKHFLGFFGRYIADISKISAIYRRYFRYIDRYIGVLACGSDLLCRKSDGLDQASFSNG